MSAKSA
jgi:hypothetical protein